MRHTRRGNKPGARIPVSLLICLIARITQPLAGQDSLPDNRITLSATRTPVGEILEEITMQSGYFFTYDATLVDRERKVDFRVEDQLLQDALDSLLGDPKVAYRLIGKNIVLFRKNESAPGPLLKETGQVYLRGRVVDAQNEKPLPFATVALHGTNLGTVTNNSGYFSFKLPAGLEDPLLTASYIGYQGTVHPVSFPARDELILKLRRETIPLQEVVIRYMDPEPLLAEALRKIPENFLDDHAAMTTYYRESVRRANRAMLFSEAVLEVAKGPYTRDVEDRARIIRARKIADVTREDTVLVKLRSGIHSSLELDVVKNTPGFLSPGFLSIYDVDFSDVVNWGDRLVYVLTFHQKPHIPDPLFQGEIYIDRKDLAIVSVDFEFNPERIRKEPGLFLVRRTPRVHIRPLYARYHVSYRKLEGRYHLSQVRAEVGMRVRKKRQWIGARYEIRIEMAVTDIHAGQKLRIRPSQRVPEKVVLTDEPFSFDPEFWGIHNTIRPEASLRESIERIDESLQEISETD